MVCTEAMHNNDHKATNILPPWALCPKVKAGFGGSVGAVSLVSADLPNEKTGGGCSAGALGFPKVKPPVVAGAGAALTSLFSPPKTNPEGAAEEVASFFSSGFPKVNAGAAVSLFVCNDPNGEPPCGVGTAELGAPNLENTEPLVAVVVVVAGLAFDMLSLVLVTLSLFSSGAAAGAALIDVVVVVVGGVFSSSLDTPKLKPPLFSVLDPVPNVTPPLAPNLNPEVAAGGSDFLSSLETVPNLKPSLEPPNLNPEEAEVSWEVVSDEELPNGTPNLKPVDDTEESPKPPNLKPSDTKVEVLSVVPNLKPPELEEEDPKVEEEKASPAKMKTRSESVSRSVKTNNLARNKAPYFYLWALL